MLAISDSGHQHLVPVRTLSEPSFEEKASAPVSASTSALWIKTPKDFSQVHRLSDSTKNLIVDPHSRLRLVRNSIAIYSDELNPLEKCLKDRNISLQFIPFGHYSITSSKNFWTTCVLVRKVGTRQSSKGNDYTIWEVNDLHNLEANWTIFLFGSCATSSTIQSIDVGSLIDLVNPNIMNDSDYNSSSSKAALSKKGGTAKFSIFNTNQIRYIGKAEDFGFCGAKRKDGNACTVAVNTLTCPVCIHHAAGELRKSNKKNKSGTKNKNTKSKPKSFVDKDIEREFNRRKGEGVITTDFLVQSMKDSFIKTAGFSAGLSTPSTKASTSKSSQFSFGKPSDFSTAPFNNVKRPLTRMELQDPSSLVKRSPIQLGNHSSISFTNQEKHHELLKPKADENKAGVSTIEKPPLVLDPSKTRHLTEKDRKILELLSCGKHKEDKSSPLNTVNVKVNSDLPSLIASDGTSAGARNILQFLNQKCSASESLQKNSKESNRNLIKTSKNGTVIMTRGTMNNMEKALNFIKKNGPIKKTDPNTLPKLKISPKLLEPVTGKRKLSESNLNEEFATSSPKLQRTMDSEKPGPSSSKGRHINSKISASTSDKNLSKKFIEDKEFLEILHAKSSHAALAEDLQEEEYFNKLERKEAIENKLLSTKSIPTTAVMCKECKYIAIGQGEFCKEQRHKIKIVQALKRFFKCKDCGQRTMSLDRLPKRGCSNCKGSNWISTSVGIEKTGPLLDSEVLSIRGDEEKFIGSASGKLFLNI